MSTAPFDYARLARLFGTPWHRHYVVSKLRSDPLYDGVFAELVGEERPLFLVTHDLINRFYC